MELAEAFGGTRAKAREVEKVENAKKEKRIEKYERSQKVREKREMFERIKERKTMNSDKKLTKQRKVTVQDGGGAEKVTQRMKLERLTVTAGSEKISEMLKSNFDETLSGGKGKIS